MKDCGIFTENIIKLDSCLDDVRSVWKDTTAKTYDVLNENIEILSQKVWLQFINAQTGYQAVRKNYNEAEFDRVLSQLSGKVNSV